MSFSGRLSADHIARETCPGSTVGIHIMLGVGNIFSGHLETEVIEVEIETIDYGCDGKAEIKTYAPNIRTILDVSISPRRGPPILGLVPVHHRGLRDRVRRGIRCIYHGVSTR